jgi:hypothetical protein
MTVALDEALVMRVRRKPREDTLTDNECVALNLFWRRNVKVPILARAFKVSKNTIYYRALTGTADSYPTSIYSNKAKEINALVDKLGPAAAWKKYVTDDMVTAVNQEMEAELVRRDADRG